MLRLEGCLPNYVIRQIFLEITAYKSKYIKKFYIYFWQLDGTLILIFSYNCFLVNTGWTVNHVSEQVDTSHCHLLHFVIDQNMNYTHWQSQLQVQEIQIQIILTRIGVLVDQPADLADAVDRLVAVAAAVVEVVEVADPDAVGPSWAYHYRMLHAYLNQTN